MTSKISVLFLVVITALVLAPSSRGQQPEKQEMGAFGLSPEAAEVANEIKVTALMGRLAAQRDLHGSPTVDTLVVRQEIMEKIVAASLDVDSVNAVIDLEIEHVRAVRGRLQARRDKAQNLVNVASIFGGGVAGVVGTAMQFSSRTANLGNGISVGGGTTSVILSIIGLHEQGGRSDLGNSPRILSRFSGNKPAAAEEVSSVFPEDVWSYINAKPCDKTSTRRNELMAKWQKEGKVDQDGLLKSEQKLKVAGRLGHEAPRLTIGEMDDVQAMLLDIIASVSLMKRDLSEIIRSLALPEPQK